MKKRKLRGYVLPSIYFVVICTLAVGIAFYSKSLLKEQIPDIDEHYNYSMSVFEQDDTNTVETSINEYASKPFMGDDAKIVKDFYKEEDTPEGQENSLIYYENTYMQNTGILYGSETVFDIVAAIDGKVKDIKQDEILGTVLTLEGKNNVRCIYYTLGEVLVKVDDEVHQNDIIAKSGQGKIDTTKQTLLFEVYINGKLTNPNTFYEKKLTELE